MQDVLGLVLAKAQPADLQHANRNGVTALHAAVVSGNAACVRMLLEAGCNPEATTKRGRSATVLALDLGHTDIARLVDDRIALQMLRSLQQAISALHLHASADGPPMRAPADGAATALESAGRAATAELGALQHAAAGAWQQMQQLLQSVDTIADKISLLHAAGGVSEVTRCSTLGDASGAGSHHRQHDIYSSQWVDDGADDSCLMPPLATDHRVAGTGAGAPAMFSPANPTNEQQEEEEESVPVGDHATTVGPSTAVGGAVALLLPAARASHHHSPSSSTLTVCYSF